MSVHDIMRTAQEQGVLLYLKDEKLAYSVRKGVISETLKSKLLEFRTDIIEVLQRQNKKQGKNELPPIELADRNQPLILSFAQNRLWFIDQLEEGSIQYNVPGRFVLKGELNIAAFKQALHELLERHEVLRTCFDDIAGEPVQIIKNNYELPLLEFDLSKLSEEQKNAQVKKIAKQDARKAFNLNQDLMIRVSLLKLSEYISLVIYTMHHIASDGWSRNILEKELSQLYKAYSDGRSNPLPQLSIQYADFAQWQQNWLQGEILDKHKTYWKKQLKDIATVHNIPLDKTRPSQQTFSGKSFKTCLNHDSTKLIKYICDSEKVTLFMFLQTAFSILISRYSNEQDVVMGTPISGRNHSDIEHLIGFFINTLVLRTQAPNSLTFTELLQRNRKIILEAYEHQSIPFEMLVEAVQPERSLSHNPIVQIIFLVQDAAQKHSLYEQQTKLVNSTNNLEVKLQDKDIKYDLELSISETDTGLSMIWGYNQSLFESETILRMAANFCSLLHSLTNSYALTNQMPATRDLDWLDQSEKQIQLKRWNSAPITLSQDENIHEMFERQVERTPDSIALIIYNQQMSYKVLNKQANLVAAYLLSLGLKTEDKVAICINRSFEMIISILAVVKAGGCFIPLDPDSPAARIQYTLDASGCKFILSRESLKGDLIWPSQIELIKVDKIIETGSDNLNAYHNIDRQSVGLCSSNIAYIIYTSGSTGKPKGVGISHSGWLNLARVEIDCFNTNTYSRILQFTSLSFDSSISQITMALNAGATLCLLSETEYREPDSLTKVIENNRITHMTLPPAMLAHLSTSNITCANALIVAGEAISKELADKWKKGRKLFNSYGPTETTVCATTSQYLGSKLHMGKPFSNVNCYVLNESKQLVPIGVEGELYIGGIQLARGYLDKPGLTAEKFIPNPFSQLKGERLYATGDLVRYLADGNIEFIGRIDHQVKIRGFRIELGEIESMLLEHKQVENAVVLAQPLPNQDKQLVAYIVSESNKAQNNSIGKATRLPSDTELSSQLKIHLGKSLPDYMVPMVYVYLDKIPLTVNGKVDKKAFPSIQQSVLQTSQYVAPRDSLESSLCEIWQSLLKIDRVGINDNFFALGGHSLLATRLVSAIRETFSVELALRQLFESPTIALMKEVLTNQNNTIVLPEISRTNRSQKLPLSYAQQRLWFIDQLEQGSVQYNIPGRFLLQGDFNEIAFKNALQSLLERHEVLRTHFCNKGGEVHQVIKHDFALPYSSYDLTQLNDKSRRLQILSHMQKESETPFNLSQDIMLRVRLLNLTKDKHIVVYTTHHIASDGWSMALLQKELIQIYEAYLADKESPLSPLNIQYADYAVWQRQWLQGELLNKHLSYWKTQLQGIASVHSLALDKPRPSQQNFLGMVYRQFIKDDLVENIKAACQSRQITSFMFLQTAFALLIGRYSNEQDVVMGTPIAGRTHRNTEELIGFFVNTLVLRTKLTPGVSFDKLLKSNKEVILDAFAHQHIPFEMLVDELNPERHLSHNPIVQILFVLQNNESSETENQNKSHQSGKDNSQSQTSIKYDLEVVITENSQGLSIGWIYNNDLFESETISRMSSNFEELIKNALESLKPQATPVNIDQLKIINKEEHQKLLVNWNQTLVAKPTANSIHQLFEKQVKETPEAIALVYEKHQLTYSELNIRANQLAHSIIVEGVCLEQPIGVYFERSLEMVIAILAVLKAGGCYVPLDPSYPNSRLEYLISDSDIQRILHNSKLHPLDSINIQREFAIQCLAIDKLIDKKNTKTYNPDISISSKNIAYYIYTSGSTGNPKGVAIQHGGVLSLLNWAINKVKQIKKLSVLASTSICFDLSVYELFLPISFGGECLIVDDILSVEMPEVHNRLTIINTVPSAAKTLLEKNIIPKNTKIINLAGEPLRKDLVDELYTNTCLEQIVDLYGPSEDTTYTTYKLRKKNDRETIGRPIDNTHLYILDKNEQIAVTGAIGELHISSDSLSRGYKNQSSLTAKKFTPNRFSSTPGERIYASGDLARYLSNGDIEFLGRKDNQVKVRGFRIELGEIESLLQNHKDIADVVVLAQQDKQLDNYLIAYIINQTAANKKHTTNNESTETKNKKLTEEYKAYLKANLPAFMIPSFFMMIDKLPLTPNGKIDKGRLPQPNRKSLYFKEYVAPRNILELKMQKLWGELLSAEKIGIHDNFFSLGGHSLLATRLVSLIREDFSTEISLRVLFESSTIASLCKIIQNTHKENLIPPISTREDEKYIPLSFAQQRIWFVDQLEQGSLQYILSGSYSLKGDFNSTFFEKALHALIERHKVLRTCYLSVAGDPQQIILDSYQLPLKNYDFSKLSDREKKLQLVKLKAKEISTPFNLSQELVLRLSLVKLSNKSHLILYSIHHIACDGWSLQIFRKELSELYELYRNNKTELIKPLEIQYADYTFWQRNWLKGEILDRQLAFWKKELKNVPATHSLTLDYPRPSKQSFEGGVYHHIINNKLLNEINEFCEQQGITLFIFLESAFAILLARFSNETDILIGTPITGRHHQSLEKLIGIFINSLALRNDLSGNPTFNEFINQNKLKILDAYDHQYIPFEILVENLDIPRSLAYHPLLQIFLNFDESVDLKLDLEPKSLNNLGDEHTTQDTKTDITLYVRHSNQQLLFSWSYLTSLFNLSSIKQMARCFNLVVEQVLNNPNIHIQEINLLDKANQKTLINNLRHEQKRQEDLATPFVHRQVETIAEQKPNAIALCHKNQQLSYSELNRKANLLANYLLLEGNQENNIIGVYMPRSIDTVITILAILKAGYCYAPLPIELPKKRIANMIAGAEIYVVVTTVELQPNLPSSIDALQIDNLNLENISNSMQPEVREANPCSHLIFTSGSSGQPKGVVGTHDSLVNRIDWMKETFPYSYHDVACQITSIGFIRAVWEMFTPLCQGVRLVIVDTDTVKDLPSLANIIYSHKISRIVTAPTLARELISIPEKNKAKLQSLQYWFVSGEPLSSELANRFIHDFSAIQLCNLYGSTEVMSDVSYFLVKHLSSRSAIPIGKPISNTSLYVLDQSRHLLPYFVPGELYVGGKSLAKGYINDEQLTQDKFIINTNNNSLDSKLFKTGDLVRRLSDGNLEYLGRADEQVKIRGFRIELAEIENQLLSLNIVKEAVIKLSKGLREDGHLVAYVVLDYARASRELNIALNTKNYELDNTANTEVSTFLTGQLQQVLPEYMTQLVYIYLGELAKKPNGKIDRKALPLLEEKHLQKESYQAPRSELEEKIYQLWKKLLKVDEIGIFDSFFNLGGHSLLATRLVSLIRQEFSIELPIRSLFESPSIAELSLTIQMYIDEKDRQSIDTNNQNVVEEGEI